MVGFTQMLSVCAWPTSDSGKACTDSSDCQGICNLPSSAYDSSAASVPILKMRAGEKLTGVCSSERSEINAPNCVPYLENGEVRFARCVD